VTGSRPGPAPTRHLTALKEGNPGHRPITDSPKLPPAKPPEPDWIAIFPATRGMDRGLREVATRCRRIARENWRQWARVLWAGGLLSEVDSITLMEAAVTVAQLDAATRDVTKRGLWVMSERGAVRNPSMTAAAQLRTALKFYIGVLGLAPAARVGLVVARDPGVDDDDVFD
jgi:hypothetical protein